MKTEFLKRNLLIFLAAAVGFCASCVPATVETAGVPALTETRVPAAPDYADAASWARLPAPERRDKPVDVFYVYPTIFRGKGGPQKMDVADAALRERADVQIRIDGGVFVERANLFAPYYRQASIEILQMDEAAGTAFLADGFSDVRRAFAHYLKNFNGGRPFILAGFSQGSMAILNLLETEFSDPRLRERLVAAYVIGWSLTREDAEKFPHLKPARGETDTGVIISYNTQRAHSGYSFMLRKNSLGINPVNWRTDGVPAPASEHKGAVIFDARTGEPKEFIPHFSETYLEAETGALVVDAPAEKFGAGKGIFPPGVLHAYDYMFFYNNLKENVGRRIDAWFGKNADAAPADVAGTRE